MASVPQRQAIAMTMGPTPEQAAAQVALIRRQRPEAQVIGIAVAGAWPGGQELRVNGETLPVAFCTSALQVSDVLVSQASDGSPMVIITNLDDDQLSLDVLARMAGRRLYRIDRWQMVRDLFRARQIDPRLASQGWIADVLLQHIPEGGYPPTASGLLDADTAWTYVLRPLGLPDSRPDAAMLLHWSLCPQNLQRYTAWSRESRDAWRQRIEDTTGALGAALLDTLDAGYGELLLPIGLACEILFSANGRQHLGIAQARARLEPYMAGRMLTSEMGGAWFAAAALVLAGLPDTTAMDWLNHTERFLADLKADDYSYLSSILPGGFNQRLVQFAADVQDFLQGTATLDRLETSFEVVRRHREATRQAERLHRVAMALRLMRYLATVQPVGGPSSFPQTSMSYVEHGGYVDWARRYLLGGDETAELAEGFRGLAQRLRQEREQQNKQFASLLAAWNKAPTATDELIPIEQALSRIVAKLARSTSLLLLIIDGMSYAVFRELSDDFRDHGWYELTDRPGQTMPSLVSTIPSVTEMSRASLLAGMLTRGNSSAEKQGFARHTDLAAASRSGYPPQLFHKGELTEASSTDLSLRLREAIRNGHQKVVAVVLNAVDDHLAKSDQLRLSWTIGQFQHLDALLYEAQLAHRVVVITSDHGHVLDEGVSRLAVGEEERWRIDSSELAEGEAVFEGSRVERVTGFRRIIAPWSETVRYAPKKHGYHGGATPQEVLVPIGVFARMEDAIEGWEAISDRKPVWWSGGETQPAEVHPTPPRHPQRRSNAVTMQESLFAEIEVSGAKEPHTDWIGHLLGSPIFAAQRRMAGRRAPDDRTVETFLRLLDQHHDRISRYALTQSLGQPEFRMRGIVVGLQRLLNVEGYQVVAVDEATGTIELNRQLLAKQFEWPSCLR
jgi:PglZ domain